MDVHNLTFRICETEKVRFRTILIYRDSNNFRVMNDLEGKLVEKTCWEISFRKSNRIQKYIFQ